MKKWTGVLAALATAAVLISCGPASEQGSVKDRAAQDRKEAPTKTANKNGQDEKDKDQEDKGQNNDKGQKKDKEPPTGR